MFLMLLLLPLPARDGRTFKYASRAAARRARSWTPEGTTRREQGRLAGRHSLTEDGERQCKRVLAHPDTLFDAGTSFWPNPV
jgi:hypothetical protein